MYLQSTVPVTSAILCFEERIKASCKLLCSNTVIALQADVPQGVIRVQAPHLSKVSMAIQLTEELKAGDIVARFLSQKRYEHIFVLLLFWKNIISIYVYAYILHYINIYYIKKKVLNA